MPNFSERSYQPELMDAPGVETAEERRALAELEVINRRLNGYRPSLRGVRRLLPPATRGFSLLDVGTGGGDLPRRLASWAGRRRIQVRITGIDLSPTAVEYARERTRGLDAVEFRRGDLFDYPAEERFDIVHAGLVLHHFGAEEATKAVRRMYDLARWGLVVNDLHRNSLAYHSIRLLTRLLSRSRLIQNDAPLSVLRAFRRRELLDLVRVAGLPQPELEWHWGFRWLLLVRKPGTADDAATR